MTFIVNVHRYLQYGLDAWTTSEVATIDAARNLAVDVVLATYGSTRNAGEFGEQAALISQKGGTVGPLADWTFIEVTCVKGA